MISEEKLTSSLEDYLEAILILEIKNRVARVKDIAELLNVRMPSVTGALKTLKSKELINYEKNSFISLTEKGMKIANGVKDKHKALRLFFQEILCMDETSANDHACRIEHDISIDATNRIRNLTEYLQDSILSSEDVTEESWNLMIAASGK